MYFTDRKSKNLKKEKKKSVEIESSTNKEIFNENFQV